MIALYYYFDGGRNKNISRAQKNDHIRLKENHRSKCHRPKRVI